MRLAGSLVKGVALLASASVFIGTAACATRQSPRVVGTRPADLIALQQGARPSGEFESTITEDSVRAHMDFLAGDALNGRGSGTREEWIAASYIGSQFRQWGLEPVDDDGFVQTILLAGAEATAPPALTAPDIFFTHGQEMLVWSMTTGRVSGALVRHTGQAQVPTGSVVLLSDAATGTNITGAGLVLAPASDRQLSAWESRGGTMPSIRRRPAALASRPPSQPSVVYLNADAYAAVSDLPDGTTVTFSADLRPTETSFTWNAVGKITGSDPSSADSVIVLSAHLDHVGERGDGPDRVYNGADDDASGTVAVLELARALAAGPGTRRTVIFALFGSEEAGGFGAGYFVDLPVIPLDRIVADLQFEMIGRPDPLVPQQTLWLTGYERSNLGAELARRGARLVPDPHPEQNFFTRSDNIRFARRGVVAHTVSSFGLHEEYHQPGDEVSTIDFAHMTTAIRSMLEPVRWLANADFRPEWAPGGRPGGPPTP